MKDMMCRYEEGTAARYLHDRAEEFEGRPESGDATANVMDQLTAAVYRFGASIVASQPARPGNPIEELDASQDIAEAITKASNSN